MAGKKIPEDKIIPSDEIPDKTDRLWAMIAHFCILLPVLPCLLIYLGFRKISPFIAYHSLQALKFQFICSLVGFVIPLILFGSKSSGDSMNAYAYCTFPVFIVGPFFGLLAGIEARRGKYFKYPFL